MASVLDALTNFLNGMGSTNAVLLGLLGGDGVDMGGPVNKARTPLAWGCCR